MKNVLKVLLALAISLCYIPFSIAISYTIVAKLTAIFNVGYENTILNTLFILIGIFVLFGFVILLNKIVEKCVKKQITYMAICTFVPIILLCIGLLVLNFNFFNLQKQVVSLNMELLGEAALVKTALMSLSAIFFTIAFLYLIVFVMYIIVYKFFRFKEKKIQQV